MFIKDALLFSLGTIEVLPLSQFIRTNSITWSLKLNKLIPKNISKVKAKQWIDSDDSGSSNKNTSFNRKGKIIHPCISINLIFWVPRKGYKSSPKELKAYITLEVLYLTVDCNCFYISTIHLSHKRKGNWPQTSVDRCLIIQNACTKELRITAPNHTCLFCNNHVY